jgi:hypothetical protein
MNIRVPINVIKSVDRENSNGRVETYIKENIRMMREMVMVRWHGLMEVDILVNG